MAVMVALRAFGADDACTSAQQAAVQCAAYGTYSAYSCDPANNAGLAAIAAKVAAAVKAGGEAAKDRAGLQAACRDSLQLNQEYVNALEQFKTDCESQRQTCTSFCSGARPLIPACPADVTALTAAVTGSESGCQNLANRVSQAQNLQNQARTNIALAQSCLNASSSATAPPAAPTTFDVPATAAVAAGPVAREAPEKIAGTTEPKPAAAPAFAPGATTAIAGPSAASSEMVQTGEVNSPAARRALSPSPSDVPHARATASLPIDAADETSRRSPTENSAKPAGESPDLRRFLPGSDLSPDRLSGREEGHKLGLCPRTRAIFDCVSERYRSQADQLIGIEGEFSK